ncbi:MAG: hypothetical protein M1826_006112 [Phylliscum demangeonii]|nr:MAG: hypothetical protein M1826_006112 [Phylliscum demangeonii]
MGRAAEFPSLFQRVLSMSLDQALSHAVRNHLLLFIVRAFQSLDTELVRKECAPLVSIGIWHNLSSDRSRELRLEAHPFLKKAWRAGNKRYEAADDAAKAKLRFDRSWLYSMILNFLDILYAPEAASPGALLYCERFVELLTDLESQLPTRRYVNSLIQELNLLSAIKLSPPFADDKHGLLRDLYALFRHFVYFAVVDHTGAQLSPTESYEAHCDTLARLQRIALKNFKEKLTILALSNYASIDLREELESHLSALADEEIVQLCVHLGYRTTYPKTTRLVRDRAFYTEVIVSNHERRKTFQEVAAELNILPTEESLFEPTLLRNESYDGSTPLALPKLNLQYLTVGDFLWRSFILYRCEAFFEIRKDVESAACLRLPALRSNGARDAQSFSKTAMTIPKPVILDIGAPRVGDDRPAFVRAEVSLDCTRMGNDIRREWESLRPDDVVFLLAVVPSTSSPRHFNGGPSSLAADATTIKHLRTAQVVQICDERGQPLRDPQPPGFKSHQYRRAGRFCKLILNLDSDAWNRDKERVAKGKSDVYMEMNLIVRRKGRENNFKPILTSIRDLILSDVVIPAWLEEVFLGYGDTTAAHHTHLPNRIPTLDFGDTFLDWKHLEESFPAAAVAIDHQKVATSEPLFRLEIIQTAPDSTPSQPSKKRRRVETGEPSAPGPSIRASAYKPPYNGPYLTDAIKRNNVRFTPKQVEAISSGMQPGLTVIIGPPGTGKTDVATQIINNLYHNFPQQRTLLVAHSNQALNQLFQKIIALDIDERHLLRLGHGEEDLETDANYSKYGRVDSFLHNRARLLHDVDKLAASLQAPGAHGNSCETAAYFKTVYVEPAWRRFQDRLHSSEETTSSIIQAFPFSSFFSDAPQPLFPQDASVAEMTEIATGCYRHIAKIFSGLEDIRPFEILRGAKDKANYLLIKEARVIAMTSTHAAMKRQEIAGLGFHYDNVVMEEAAQITEIESFITLAMQHSKDGTVPLQRIVLCGDHLQNSPVIQNLAFRQFANLEQSLFLRLVRQGVPTLTLDKQGRARPSLAGLYRWRYQHLGDLPIVQTAPEYQQANAGFRYEYQFIDVPDYKGAGESEPSPHFIQNLGEAEYAVAIYQYMRLLGYPASSITILATYAGQRALIRDVLSHRCARNPLFGLPRIVATVDKYQGEQSEYIILSLTRSSRVGYLRDVRRMTVALSRARLGLYILGRREVFETSYELRHAFDLLFQRPDTLQLTTGEMYPTSRALEEVASVTMEGVEHLGQYVYEMTQARVAALKALPDGGTDVPGAIAEPNPDADADAEMEDVQAEAEAEAEDVEEVDGANLDEPRPE